MTTKLSENMKRVFEMYNTIRMENETLRERVETLEKEVVKLKRNAAKRKPLK